MGGGEQGHWVGADEDVRVGGWQRLAGAWAEQGEQVAREFKMKAGAWLLIAPPPFKSTHNELQQQQQLLAWHLPPPTHTPLPFTPPPSSPRNTIYTPHNTMYNPPAPGRRPPHHELQQLHQPLAQPLAARGRLQLHLVAVDGGELLLHQEPGGGVNF